MSHFIQHHRTCMKCGGTELLSPDEWDRYVGACDQCWSELSVFEQNLLQRVVSLAARVTALEAHGALEGALLEANEFAVRIEGDDVAVHREIE